MPEGHSPLPPSDDFSTRSTSANSRWRLLLAEDNTVNQRVAVAMLNRLGYRTDVVANGREAVTALSRVPYDLVLMDCQMPEMDGYDATRAIRAEGSAVLDRNLPIIAVTANVLKGDSERCLAAGMDDYLPKPIEAKALAAVLARHLKLETAPFQAPGVLEWEVFLGRLGGDQAVARALLAEFCTEAPRHLKSARAALGTGDRNGARQTLQRLSEDAANFLAPALVATAADAARVVAVAVDGDQSTCLIPLTEALDAFLAITSKLIPHHSPSCVIPPDVIRSSSLAAIGGGGQRR
jgi:CheY-like chemotaxis protein